ncbi:hypothetical protein KC318_g12735 [Hortaea werneckii]|nr:hypothetical protein KC334_g12895 [Hortaea werneckii]KAI7004060.1 hypothetical protein KC355_g8899 [Hortaea werneckii]KAI7655918.1 hypothetical protein KC318_g12735 [Hortaea werneckii]
MAPRRSARIKALATFKTNQAPALPSLLGVKQQQKSTKPKAGKPKTTTTTTGEKKGKGGGVTKTKKKPTSTTKSKSKKTTTTTKRTKPKTTTSRTSASPAKTFPVKDLATTLQSRATEAMANIARKVSSSAEAIASPTNNTSNTGSPSRKPTGALAKAAEVISPNKGNRGRRAASSPSPGKSGVGAGAGTVARKGRAKSEGRA